MNFQLSLTKENQVVEKFSLNLKKDEKFTVILKWTGDTDLDSHALLCRNGGSGGKISTFEDILSTYNVKRQIGGQVVGTLDKDTNGNFEIYGGALVHTADLTGAADEEVETIVINPAKLPTMTPGSAYEIPIIAMIHPQSGAKKFKDVQNASVVILDDIGGEIMKATLSNEFGEFIGVQMGSIIIDSTGTHFEAVGVGFNEDFNGVLGYFS
jgi:tellurium resistance protein TerD